MGGGGGGERKNCVFEVDRCASVISDKGAKLKLCIRLFGVIGII